MTGEFENLSKTEQMAIRYYLRKKAFSNHDFDYSLEMKQIAGNKEQLARLVDEYLIYAYPSAESDKKTGK